MKYILAVMCAIAALFMGGCAVLTLAAGPFVILPAGLAFLNIAILGYLFGWKVQWRPAFYVLGIIDLLVMALSLYLAAMLPASDRTALILVAGVFAAKGILSLVYGAYYRRPDVGA